MATTEFSKSRGRTCYCFNPACRQKLHRSLSTIPQSKRVFCSHHCAATITNSTRTTQAMVRRQTKIDNQPKCLYPTCYRKVLLGNDYFCSKECQILYKDILKRELPNKVITAIKAFYDVNQRIPLKREMWKFYRKARTVFGTWNNAVKAAGYNPNPVKFAHHFQAKDGHTCDSLTEKILDDWLTKHKIKHEVHVVYPWNNKMKSDFKVGNYWIELFGLEGENKRYDQLKNKKLKLIQKYHLNIITLSLKDIYSNEILNRKLKPILENISLDTPNSSPHNDPQYEPHLITN